MKVSAQVHQVRPSYGNAFLNVTEAHNLSGIGAWFSAYEMPTYLVRRGIDVMVWQFSTQAAADEELARFADCDVTRLDEPRGASKEKSK
jgi:hypothetical protein